MCGDLNNDERYKVKKLNVCESENCINQMLSYINKKWKRDPKILKNRIARYDNKLTTVNAVRFDNLVVLQKMRTSYFVKQDETVDLFSEKRIVKTSRGILIKTLFKGYVGNIPHYATLTSNYCHLK